MNYEEIDIEHIISNKWLMEFDIHSFSHLTWRGSLYVKHKFTAHQIHIYNDSVETQQKLSIIHKSPGKTICCVLSIFDLELKELENGSHCVTLHGTIEKIVNE